MANVMSHDAAISHADTVDETRADAQSPTYQAYQILRIAFTVAPIIAGLEYITRVSTDWDKYLAPMANNILGGSGHAFMMVVGVIEIIAGIGVFLKPKV